MSAPSKESILAFFREHKAEMRSEFGVQEIGIFGSYATSSQTSTSDIDIVVELENSSFDCFARLHDYLEEHLQRSVDITRLSPQLNSPFRDRIKKVAQYA